MRQLMAGRRFWNSFCSSTLNICQSLLKQGRNSILWKKIQGLEPFSSSNKFEFELRPPHTFNCTWIFLLFLSSFGWLRICLEYSLYKQLLYSFSSFFKIKQPLLNILLQQDVKILKNTNNIQCLTKVNL